jgi:prolipoprotein diacylglyceryl transferase
MIWNIDPVFFSIGSLSVRYYGLCFMLAFLCGYCLINWIYREEKQPIASLDSLFTYMFLGTIIGARLGHVLFYQPDWYFNHPSEILKIWHGGLASHGAAIGIFIALWLFQRKHQEQKLIWVISRVCIAIALAGFFIRLGNFFNSEIYGVPTDLPWSVIFLRESAEPRHPTQLYESLSYLGIFGIMFSYYYKHRAESNSYFLLGFFFIAVFTARFILEFTKDYQAEFEAGLPLHIGQLLSIPLILIGAYLIRRKS